MTPPVGTFSWIRASAPGKLMLLGEHAVLYGQPALVCAIDRRMSVWVRRRTDGHVAIRSELGELKVRWQDLRPRPPFTFLLTALREFADRLGEGVELRVESEFSGDVGFGSSAAVAVCAVAALSALANETVEPEGVFRRAAAVVRAVQKRASGADVAASVFGGTLLYSAENGVLRRCTREFPLVAVYSGAKTPTPEVIRRVDEEVARFQEILQPVFRAMGASAERAFEALADGRLREAGRILRINQGLMDALGVSTPDLWQIVHRLQEETGIWGAKISGSGLGDCVVGLGEASEDLSRQFPVFRLRPSAQGVTLD